MSPPIIAAAIIASRRRERSCGSCCDLPSDFQVLVPVDPTPDQRQVLDQLRAVQRRVDTRERWLRWGVLFILIFSSIPFIADYANVHLPSELSTALWGVTMVYIFGWTMWSRRVEGMSRDVHHQFHVLDRHGLIEPQPHHRSTTTESPS